MQNQLPAALDSIPVPVERVPKYPLHQLPDPPDDYEFLGRPFALYVRARGVPLPTLLALAKFHLWGFDYGPEKRLPILRALGKINYYMREEYKFTAEGDLFDFKRDGGPRLFHYTVTPLPFPVSRHYPCLLTQEEMVQLGVYYYVRPDDAPPEVSDAFIFQFLLPPNPPLAMPLPTAPIDPAATVDPTTSVPLGHVAPDAIPPELLTEDDVNQVLFVPTSNPLKPADPIRTRTLQSRVMPAGQKALQAPTDFNPNSIREAIERAIMRLCYEDLERHPHAPSKDPVPTRIACSQSDLNIVQIGTFATISELRLNPVSWSFDVAGFPFPYRGRGPVWADGSCAIDTSIVLGMLTMAGCTKIDRHNGAEDEFTELEKAFIQVTNMNWEAFDDKVSIELRHSFFNLMSDNIPDIQKNSPVPIWVVWAESTRNFAQFQMRYQEHPMMPCSNCGYQDVEFKTRVGNCLNPFWEEGDQYGVKMSALFRRAFFPNAAYYPCPNCNSRTGPQKVNLVTHLPLRLVVSTAGGFRVLNHTENQYLVYRDADGKEQSAIYRWLGGAYYQNNHVRVYWNDAERGEYDSGNLRRYDGQQAGGCIVGGIAPYSLEDRVPPQWTREGIPIAIYERVINPTQEMLDAASGVVLEMVHMNRINKPFLLSHYPWTPSDTVRKSPYLPLERILPDTGERFYEKCITPAAQTQTQQVNPDTNRVLADQLAEWQMQSTSLDFMSEQNNDQFQIDPGVLQRLEQGESLFTSLNDNPNDLINHPEMWPEGVPPQTGGTTTFPNLPKTPPRPNAPKSPYWSFMNFSPDNNTTANGVAEKDAGEETVTIVNIRADCRAGPSPYRLYRVPVKSIKAAMRRLSEKKEKESQSAPKKKRPRVQELKDDEIPSPKRAQRRSASK